MTEPATTFVIDGHTYEMRGAALLAERYDDGIELWITNVHSNLIERTAAIFVRIGPRGGVSSVAMGFKDEDEIEEWRSRLYGAAIHLARVDGWRQAYVGWHQ